MVYNKAFITFLFISITFLESQLHVPNYPKFKKIDMKNELLNSFI